MKRRRLYDGTKPYAYVAFNYRDAVLAEKVLDSLDEAGYRFWLNAKLETDEEGLREIADKVNMSSATVLVLSENSMSDRVIDVAVERTIFKRNPLVLYLTEETPETSMYLSMLLEKIGTVVVIRVWEQEFKVSNAARQALSAAKGLTEEQGAYYFNSGLRVLQSGGASREHLTNAMKSISYAASNEYCPALDFLGDVALEKARNGYESYSTAISCYKTAADLGSIHSIYTLGCMLADGEGFAKNSYKAVTYLSVAAQYGYPDAQYRLAVMTDKGDGIKIDRVEASTMYKKALESGDRRAYMNLAYRYLNGDMLAKDEQKAAEYFQEAANDGNVQAYLEIAKLYRIGKGVPQNEKLSSEYFLKAAKADISEAQYYYALYLQKQRNYVEAFRWLMAAARERKDGTEASADTLYAIAQCYEKGRGVEADRRTAFLYYYEAAEKGSEKARVAVSECYRKGIGVPVNKKAAAFFEE